MSKKSWVVGKWLAVPAVVAAVVVALGIYVRGGTEPVTRERLAAAKTRWDQARLTSYDMEVETSGAQTGRYHIEVRDGQLSKITRNGQAVAPAEGEYWTVEGLFRVIEDYLDAAEQPHSDVFPEGSQVWLRMRCDATLGYPRRFILQVKQPSRRSVTGYESAGASLGVQINVTRLEARSDH